MYMYVLYMSLHIYKCRCYKAYAETTCLSRSMTNRQTTSAFTSQHRYKKKNICIKVGMASLAPIMVKWHQANTSKKGSEEQGKESVEQEPQKQLKRGKCGWLDAERDIGSVGVKVHAVSGLKRCLHIGRVFPFHTESEVSRKAHIYKYVGGIYIYT